MEIIKKITIVFLIIFLGVNFSLKTYAAEVPVTKQNLNEALQKLAKSSKNEEISQILVEDKKIKITTKGKDYFIGYDLTGNPTFNYEFEVKEGINYNTFEEETDRLISPLIGYIGVANVQGVNIEDAFAYAMMEYLSNALNGLNNKNLYVIIDDTDIQEGVTIDKNNSNPNTIYVSEFGNRVMEYVNETYKDKMVISDAKDGINSFEMVIERKNVTETSCKLSSKLIVKTNADFSKIKGYASKNVLDKNITRENADYVVDLSVGQKCRFETEEKITGHQIQGFGYECKKINENCLEIIGTKEGISNGRIYIGNEQKTFLITTKNNTQNTDLKTKVIKIYSANNSKNNSNNINSNNNEKIKSDTKIKRLPNAGIKNAIYILISVIAIAMIIAFTRYKKLKDI